MLHEFLQGHRNALIELCTLKTRLRRAPDPVDPQLEHGIPLFIDQLIATLQAEQPSAPIRSATVAAPTDGGKQILSEIRCTALQHGRELAEHGFTVDQVVHGYGDLCQAVTELAVERGESMQMQEFRTFNRCLDDAIADAATEFSYLQMARIAEQGTQALNERLGFLAHELRNHIQAASLALMAIKSGRVGLHGATGAVLERSLIDLRSLVDRSLADVRVTAGLPPRQQLISLADFIDAQSVSASLEAQAQECTLKVSAVDSSLAVEVDRDLLSSAVGNLLQNAFKFTRPGTEVVLSAYAAADRILIEVEDRCGGLPSGQSENMFLPFVQGSDDKSGLGLGLSISQRSVAANNGVLSVRNLADCGCIFTIDLPRHALPATGAA